MKQVIISKIVNGYIAQTVHQWEPLEGGAKIRIHKPGHGGKFDPVYCKDMDQVLATVERMLEDAGGKKGSE